MRSLRYTRAASEDLNGITRYIAGSSGSAGIARTFAARLDEHCKRLASLPATLGTLRPELGSGLRSTPFRGYVIFFRYVKDAIEIVTILEGHRDVARHFSGNDNDPASS